MKLIVAITAFWLVLACAITASYINMSSDAYIRDRVVKLYSAMGSCSGIQVKTPSQKVVILTAAHCAVLGQNMKVRLENGDVKDAHILSVDVDKDLMIVSGVTADFVRIAEGVSAHEAAHSMTHGSGYPSYRTDGELLEERDVNIGLPTESCKHAKNGHIVKDPWGYTSMCLLNHRSMMSTVWAVPGSSGGGVFNSSGELIGIVSHNDTTGVNFTGLVTLKDIKDFLHGQ